MKTAATFIVLSLFLRANLWAQDNWFWQNPFPHGNRLNDVHVFDQNTAITVGDLGKITKTTDGGANWSEQNNAGGAFILSSVSFINANTGWAVGRDEGFRGYISKTTNGGTSWALQRSVQPGSEEFLSVHFIDAQNGWAVGWDRSCGIFGGCTYFGIIYQTTDGGSN